MIIHFGGFNMNVEIINVGTELLLGEIVNTNADFITEGMQRFRF